MTMSGKNVNGSSAMRAHGLRKCLANLGLPSSMLPGILEGCHSVDSRISVVDNSAFMKVRDSHVVRTADCGRIERVDDVSRWEELQEALAFQCRVASSSWLPTKFFLLNEQTGLIAPDYGTKLSLCWHDPEDIPGEIKNIKHVIKHINLGEAKCELTRCIKYLSRCIEKGAFHLASRDKRITVILFTQGMPTNGRGQSGTTIRQEFREALWSLTKLPVKVLIRLCTDDDKVTTMFNEMDDKFDSIDVLDDYWGEAMEVYLHNPWLTYSLGLHRLRENGLAPEVFGDLDQRPLTLDEIHEVCQMLFVGDDASKNLPLPPYQPTSGSQLKRASWINSWVPFIIAIESLMKKQRMQWNPIRRRMTPWIDMKKLESSLKGQFARDGARRGDFRGRDPDGARGGFHARDPDGVRGGARAQSERHQRGGFAKPPPAPRRSNSTPIMGSNHLTLEEVIQQWSHKPPDYKRLHSLQRLLISVPDILRNEKVERHDYFARWPEFDEEAFADMSRSEMEPLLKRAMRKVKFFLHPDKLPKDLTENQQVLFRSLWDVLSQQEAAVLGR